MGILQARILEWIAMPSSRGSSWPRDGTHVSCVSCIGRQVLYHQRHLGSPMYADRLSHLAQLVIDFAVGTLNYLIRQLPQTLLWAVTNTSYTHTILPWQDKFWNLASIWPTVSEKGLWARVTSPSSSIHSRSVSERDRSRLSCSEWDTCRARIQSQHLTAKHVSTTTLHTLEIGPSEGKQLA